MTDWVHWSKCCHKFDDLVSYVGTFMLPIDNLNQIILCLNMDTYHYHEEGALCRKNCQV